MNYTTRGSSRSNVKRETVVQSSDNLNNFHTMALISYKFLQIRCSDLKMSFEEGGRDLDSEKAASFNRAAISRRWPRSSKEPVGSHPVAVGRETTTTAII